jgi:uncharacterized membrane protein YqiK
MPLLLQAYGITEPDPTLLGMTPSMLWWVVAAAVALAVAVLGLIQFIRLFLFIARPSETLVFSGGIHLAEDGSKVGYRLVKNGQRAIRVPILETVSALDMTVLPIDVVVQNAYSRGNIPLEIHAIANVKIHSDPRWLRNAVERFNTKSKADIQLVAQQTLEGALREVLAQLTPEEVNEDRLKFAEKLIHAVEDDLQKGRATSTRSGGRRSPARSATPRTRRTRPPRRSSRPRRRRCSAASSRAPRPRRRSSRSRTSCVR